MHVVNYVSRRQLHFSLVSDDSEEADEEADEEDVSGSVPGASASEDSEDSDESWQPSEERATAVARVTLAGAPAVVPKKGETPCGVPTRLLLCRI